MKEPESTMSTQRRTFLKVAVAAGGATALAPVAASPPDVLSADQAAADPGSANRSKGYHETQHIKDYYRTLRE